MTFVFKNMPVFVYTKKIKHVYVRVKSSGCHVSAPKNISTKWLDQYLLDNELRILSKYEKLNLIEYTVLGRPIKIHFSHGKFQYDYQHPLLTIRHEENFDLAFKTFLMIEFKSYIDSIQFKVETHLKAHNLQPVSIKIKYLRSKFGSYHRIHHQITLNSYLFMLDPSLIQYVLMHEYAHTKEFNHQKAFYDLQHQLCPNDKELSKRLKTLTIPEHFKL